MSSAGKITCNFKKEVWLNYQGQNYKILINALARKEQFIQQHNDLAISMTLTSTQIIHMNCGRNHLYYPHKSPKSLEHSRKFTISNIIFSCSCKLETHPNQELNPEMGNFDFPPVYCKNLNKKFKPYKSTSRSHK